MKVLVTGGGGFLGQAIVRQLLQARDTVVTFQRGDYPWLRELGVETIRGDLAHRDAVVAACKGCEAVFHVAAKAGVWGEPARYYRANVLATDHVLHACRRHSIPYLIYTSTPSVVFDGHDETGIDETQPYTRRFLNAYQRTKVMAEQRVLAANTGALRTVALRPHLIWGPADPHLVRRVIERQRAGRLRLVGNGRNRVDSCYVDNAARAHILARDALVSGRAAGNAYFISNGEPLAIRILLDNILAAAGLPAVTRTISPTLAYQVGAVLECVYRAIGRREEPLMTRFVARQLATEHWFDLRAAKRDLHYKPILSIDEGMRRLAAAFATGGEGSC